jgi:hypothetical protein
LNNLIYGKFSNKSFTFKEGGVALDALDGIALHYEKQAHTQLVPHVGHFLMPLT